MDPSLPPPIVSMNEEATAILSVKSYFVASFTVLLYDYCLTLGSEIEYVWHSDISLVSLLFFANRYSSLIFAIVTLISYFNPEFNTSVCNRYSLTQFIHTVITFTIAEVFLALRCHVLTHRRKDLTGFLAGHIFIQLILSFYIMSRGGGTLPLQDPLNSMDQYQLCMLFPKRGQSTELLPFHVSYLCLALSFQVIVFAITLVVTITTAKTHPTMRIMKVVQRGGIVYFVAIFSSTLTWTVMVLHAKEPHLKLINAEPAMILTAVLINRLHLSVKKIGRRPETWVSPRDRGTGGNVPLEIIISQQITSQLR